MSDFARYLKGGLCPLPGCLSPLIRHRSPVSGASCAGAAFLIRRPGVVNCGGDEFRESRSALR